MHLKIFEAMLGASVALTGAAVGLWQNDPSTHTAQAAETVEVRAIDLDYPAPGEFLVSGRPAAAPVETTSVPRFRITKQQVGAREYARCVADGACQPADNAAQRDADVPVTGVSYLDAVAFAQWYSSQTGYAWRLPTAAEAAAAAGERFQGDAFSPVVDDPNNPAVAWIRRYKEEAAAKRPRDPQPKARGFYGTNTLGVEDFGGNVWEWTSTCYSRVALAAGGEAVESVVENCGVHVLEGRHRAYMSNFVRDGRSGGCAVDTPPDNLGFRLVRDDPGCGLACWISALGAGGGPS